MRSVEQRNARDDTAVAPDGGWLAIEAPAIADQWSLWHALAPRLLATGALHAEDCPLFRVFISLATTYGFLRGRGLPVDSTFRDELFRQAARFGLTPDDVDQFVASLLPCAAGVH